MDVIQTSISGLGMGGTNIFSRIYPPAQQHGNEHRLVRAQVRHVNTLEERVQSFIRQNPVVEKLGSVCYNAAPPDQLVKVFDHGSSPIGCSLLKAVISIIHQWVGNGKSITATRHKRSSGLERNRVSRQFGLRRPELVVTGITDWAAPLSKDGSDDSPLSEECLCMLLKHGRAS